jgi:hypothetical protein
MCTVSLSLDTARSVDWMLNDSEYIVAGYVPANHDGIRTLLQNLRKYLIRNLRIKTSCFVRTQQRPGARGKQNHAWMGANPSDIGIKAMPNPLGI